MVLTRRAAKVLQIATSLGVLKPTVLPFGIHGGPAGCQKMVNDIFWELIQESLLKAFIDDIAAGTRKALDQRIPNPVDVSNPLAAAAFDEHLEVLARMLEAMIDGGLKMKLSKCYFAEFITHCLAFIVGRGV